MEDWTMEVRPTNSAGLKRWTSMSTTGLSEAPPTFRDFFPEGLEWKVPCSGCGSIDKIHSVTRAAFEKNSLSTDELERLQLLGFTESYGWIWDSFTTADAKCSKCNKLFYSKPIPKSREEFYSKYEDRWP